MTLRGARAGMADLEAIKRKIRGLLAMAEKDSGATDAEKSTSKALAEKMMAKYGLSENEIPRRSIEREPKTRLQRYARTHPGNFFEEGYFAGTVSNSTTTTNSFSFKWE